MSNMNEQNEDLLVELVGTSESNTREFRDRLEEIRTIVVGLQEGLNAPSKTWVNRSTHSDGSFAENLSLQVFDRPPQRGVDKTCLPELIALLDETLTEKEALAVKMHLGFDEEGFDGKMHSFAECGNVLDVSRGRAGQIWHRALRKLRHPSRSHRLKYFFVTRAELLAELDASKQKNKELATINYCYKKQIAELRRRGHGDLSDVGKISTEDEDGEEASMDIESLDLSVRSYNCLKRAGVNNVNALIDLLKEKKLIDVRNLGVKCTREVEEKMRSMGFTFPDNA